MMSYIEKLSCISSFNRWTIPKHSCKPNYLHCASIDMIGSDTRILFLIKGNMQHFLKEIANQLTSCCGREISNKILEEKSKISSTS